LNKRNIKDINDLDKDEKENLDKWSRILSEGEITVAKISEFCQNQKRLIEAQFLPGLEDKKAKDLTVLHSVYSALINLITGPKAERESLEKYLNQLIQ
jgi:hypothetical protein